MSYRKDARRAAFTAATVNSMHTYGQGGFRSRLSLIPAMMRDTMAGRYDGLGRGRLAVMVLGFAYLLSPVDLLPEALLTVPGLLDDTAVAVWLLAALMASVDRYAASHQPIPVTVTIGRRTGALTPLSPPDGGAAPSRE